MKLIVGLGNPERRYQGTRHNVGFMVLAELARQCGTGRPKAKFHGEVVDAVVGGQKALLLSPLTYMNRSGISVHEARDFYKLPLEDLLIICDDLNLPLAKLRFRASGSRPFRVHESGSHSSGRSSPPSTRAGSIM